MIKERLKEEHSSNQRFFLKMKMKGLDKRYSYLNWCKLTKTFKLDTRIESDLCKTKFTEDDIEGYLENVDGFDELLSHFERENVKCI